MKLKWKSTLLALCMCGGIISTSCSDNDALNGKPDPENPLEEGDVYLSFRMLSGLDIMLPTKADFEDGDDAENAVDEALWVLYSGDDKVAYSETLQAKTDGSLGNNFEGNDVSNSADRGSFTMKAKLIKAQDYRLLVVLNPTAAIKNATAKGRFLSEFEAAKTTHIDEVSSAKNGSRTKIVMTNADGLVEVNQTHLHKTPEAAEIGPKPTVQVDRILAKVTLDMKEQMEYPNGGELKNAVWKLDITNKKTYWMREKTYYAPIVTGNASAGSGSWIMENGSQTNKRLFYAKDPNWDNVSLFRQGENDRTSLAEEFNFETSGVITDLSSTKPLSTQATREYVLENTMAAGDQWEDVTTRILILGNYVPAGFKDLEKKVKFAEGDSYYFFGGSAFSFEQIKTWYEDIPNENKDYPWPDAPRNLKEEVEKAVADQFIDMSETNGRSESGSNGKLHFYKEGQSYYSALIRHFEDAYSAGNMNFGRYGVARNNVYKVTLTKITGPGTPNIPDPEGPDDKDEKYLSTEIKVLPWVVRTQNLDL